MTKGASMKKMLVAVYLIAMAAAAMLSAPGCGGGRGSSQPSVASAPTGMGKVAATVKLTGGAQAAGRAAAAATGTIDIKITISGVYSENETEFDPITAETVINIASGSASVPVVGVPIGVNHLIVVDAVWNGVATETIKAIIPQVAEGESTTVAVDQASTVVADTALFLAQETGKKLYQIEATEIAEISAAVAAMAANGISYYDMTPAAVLAYMSQAAGTPSSAIIVPATATVPIGSTATFYAEAFDTNGAPVSSATFTWDFQPSSVGSVDSTGIFTAIAAGTGTLTASYNGLLATAEVVVTATCAADSDCNDNDPLTTDVCVAPNTIDAHCTNTPAQNQPPTATATVTPATGIAPLDVTLTADCSDTDGTCTSYTWDFGDGSPTISAQNATHTYTTPGTYTATLTVTDDQGATAVQTATVVVTPANGAPVASASASPTSGTASLAVNFTGGCTDSDGTCVAYEWDFGDGATSALQSPSHTFTSSGTYNVTLMVTDNTGATGTDTTISISVSAPNVPPTASSGASSISGIAPLDVTLNGSCTDSDGTCVSYSWDFGDGSPAASTLNATHTYSTTGTFIATLTVTDNQGATAIGTTTITVSPNQPPVAGIFNDFASGTTPLPVNFTGNCSDPDGSCVSFLWDFGDGSPTISTQNASHTFTATGTFIVTFTITDDKGASSQATTSISVTPLAVCGNAAIEPGEECDDANLTDGDGCSSACFSEIAPSMEYVCAMNKAYSGGAECWGRNQYGQLGNNATATILVPSAVSGLTSGVVQIKTGAYHTCVLTTTGGVKCWGWNTYGQVGNGGTTDQIAPVDVVGLTSGVKQISTGGTHTCALTDAGGVKCWGSNSNGQLGVTGGNSPTPVDVTGLTSGVAYVGTYGYSSCALLNTGGVKCWGKGNYGALGDGTWNSSNTPVDVSGLSSGVVGISSGNVDSEHVCALLTTGGLKCWGANATGQLGNSSNTDTNAPVDVTGLTSGVKYIGGEGYQHTCAVTSSNDAKCWGNNAYGALGDGTTTSTNFPGNVSVPLGTVSVISGTRCLTCYRITAGSMYCFGDNSYGQYGTGNTISSLTPVLVGN